MKIYAPVYHLPAEKQTCELWRNKKKTKYEKEEKSWWNDEQNNGETIVVKCAIYIFYCMISICLVYKQM